MTKAATPLPLVGTAVHDDGLDSPLTKTSQPQQTTPARSGSVITPIGHATSAAVGPPCDVTVLSALHNKVMRKQYSLDQHGKVTTTDYDKAMYFGVQVFRVTDIQGLSGLVSRFSKGSKAVLIRGAPSQAVHDFHRKRVVRKKENFPEPAEGLPWAMLDFDKIPVPPGVAPTSMEAIECLIAKLPPAFHQACYFFQFSSSTGIMRSDGVPYKTGVNVHLFFYFSRPVPGKVLAAYLRKHCIETQFYERSVDRGGTPRIIYGVDESVLKSPVQPLYVALPQIGPGVVCNLSAEERQGLVKKGHACVELPSLDDNVIDQARAMHSQIDHAWKVENGFKRATSMTAKRGSGVAVTSYYKNPNADPTKLGRVLVYAKVTKKDGADGQSVSFARLYFDGESSPGSWYVSSHKPTIARRFGDGQEEHLKQLSESAYAYVRGELKWFDEVVYEEMSLQDSGFLPAFSTFMTSQVTLLLAPTGSGKTKAFIDHVVDGVRRGEVYIYAAQTIALTNQMRDDLRASQVRYVHYSDIPAFEEMHAGVYITTNESLRRMVALATSGGVRFTLVIDEVHAALDDFMTSNQKHEVFENAMTLAERTIMMTGTITPLQIKKISEAVQRVKKSLSREVFKVCRFAPVRQYPLRVCEESAFPADLVALMRTHQAMKARGEALPRIVVIVPTSDMDIYAELLAQFGLTDVAMVVSRTDVTQEDIEAARTSNRPWLISSPLFAIGLTFEHAPVRFWTCFGRLQVDTSQVIQTLNRANRTGVACEVRLYAAEPDPSPAPQYSEFMEARERQEIEQYLMDESEVPGVIDPHFLLDRATYNELRTKVDKHTGRAMYQLLEVEGIENYVIENECVDDIAATKDDKKLYQQLKHAANELRTMDVAHLARPYAGETTPLQLHFLKMQGQRKREFWNPNLVPKKIDDMVKAIAASLTGNPEHYKRHNGPHATTLRRLFAHALPWLSAQYSADKMTEQGKAAADKVLQVIEIVDLLERLQTGEIPTGVDFGKKMRQKAGRRGVLALAKGEADYFAQSRKLEALDKLHAQTEKVSTSKRKELNEQFFKAAAAFLKDLGVNFGKTKGADGRQRLDPSKPIVPSWDWDRMRLALKILAESLAHRSEVVVDLVLEAQKWPGGPVSLDLCRHCVHCTLTDECMLGGPVQSELDEPGERSCDKHVELPAVLRKLKFEGSA